MLFGSGCGAWEAQSRFSHSATTRTESPAAVGTTQQGISRARYYSAFFEDQLQMSDGPLQRPAPVTQQDDCAPPQRTTRRGTDGLHDSPLFELPVPRERRYRDLTFCAGTSSARVVARTKSIIFSPCVLQRHTALDRRRGRPTGHVTHRRGAIPPRCRSASSPSSLRWSGRSRSARRSFRYRLRTHRARQRRSRPRRCCADLRRTPPDRF